MLLKKAFTLIELLIVVAIIAILAAIAVPNFLEAQTRSKVSRTKADMRSVSVALEAYATDNNRYPYVNQVPGWGLPAGP
jgi:type II secretion system protein G